MIHIKTRVIPEFVVEEEAHRTCDICGKWLVAATYNVDRVNVSREVGTVYPEGGHVYGIPPAPRH
jgi:hypothetical protein